MLIKHDSSCMIYFGNATDNLNPPFYYLDLPSQPLLSLEPFNKLVPLMPTQELFFLNQTHSADGLAIDKNNVDHTISFKKDGDYLITNLKNVALGVMTADCLSLVIFDRVHNAVGVIHAGWRGTVQAIAGKMLAHMKQLYKTRPEDCDLFFGPAAKNCCYEVGPEFEGHLAGYQEYLADLLINRDNKLYFDLIKFNQIQLALAGVKKEFMHMENSACTICNHEFSSWRRQKEACGGQMTVVCLV